MKDWKSLRIVGPVVQENAADCQDVADSKIRCSLLAERTIQDLK